ncbi:MAG TPA: hypothetical protein VJL29_07420, partial [Thermoguttaceae bacterium]|nr:hypothetical protein [Thermoguttaceae bacterium]
VMIRRHVPGQAEPVTIVASLRQAIDGKDNVLLAPGDTVMVRQTPATVVVDAVRTFFHVGIGSTFTPF